MSFFLGGSPFSDTQSYYYNKPITINKTNIITINKGATRLLCGGGSDGCQSSPLHTSDSWASQKDTLFGVFFQKVVLTHFGGGNCVNKISILECCRDKVPSHLHSRGDTTAANAGTWAKPLGCLYGHSDRKNLSASCRLKLKGYYKINLPSQ